VTVAVILGSASDLPIARKVAQTLDELGIQYEVTVSSAHRSPERTEQLARELEQRGFAVAICIAGMAAHLAGVVAAHTVLPVVGVPTSGGALGGQDALLATVQMPPGVPVATVGIDAGRNAALLAAEILALGDEALRERLREMRRKLAQGVEEAAAKVQKAIRENAQQ